MDHLPTTIELRPLTSDAWIYVLEDTDFTILSLLVDVVFPTERERAGAEKA